MITFSFVFLHGYHEEIIRHETLTLSDGDHVILTSKYNFPTKHFQIQVYSLRACHWAITGCTCQTHFSSTERAW